MYIDILKIYGYNYIHKISGINFPNLYMIFYY